MTRTYQYVRLTEYLHWLSLGWVIVIKPDRLTDALAGTHHGQYSVLMELPK